MSATNINIWIDSEIESQAQAVFAAMGFDMSTAINIFLKQTVQQHCIPFDITDKPVQVKVTPYLIPPDLTKTPQPGCMRGKNWMADDFDAPMEDFEDHGDFDNVSPLPNRKVQFDCMKGEIWMADDFDAPLEEFEEYM